MERIIQQINMIKNKKKLKSSSTLSLFVKSWHFFQTGSLAPIVLDSSETFFCVITIAKKSRRNNKKHFTDNEKRV